jgi:CRP-like cAMP-binding protein
MNLATPSRPNAKLPNHILSALPAAEYQQVEPFLRTVHLERGQVLYEIGDTIQRVYFFSAGFASLVLTSTQGVDVEVCVVGNEGVVGDEAAREKGKAFRRTVVQMSGDVRVLPAPIFRQEFDRSKVWRDLVLRHQQSTIAQTSQSTLCNRLHQVEERLARWLLMAQDRCGTDQLNLTQEFLSQMLGVRRSGVTIAAGVLRAAGAIDYKRGAITICDRHRLRGCACECYDELKKTIRSFGLDPAAKA